MANYTNLAKQVVKLTSALSQLNSVKKTRKKKTKRKGMEQDYDSVSIPAATGVIRRNFIPDFVVRRGSTVINNTEPLKVVTLGVAGAFTFDRIALIPANFPWLFRIASSWQKFRIRRLCAVYTPVASSAISGEVILAITYDRRDIVASTMMDAGTIYDSVSSPVWGGSNGLHHMKPGKFAKAGPGVVCADMDPSHLTQPYYNFAVTSTFNGMTTNDQNSYCPASLDVYTNGGPALATEVGKVWIHYEIELVDPMSSILNA